ncbi:MAG: BamA/TamA family outer membrane protein [bacterium]|nr:BamA/TamA family outer membrane protein [bacterium]
MHCCVWLIPCLLSGLLLASTATASDNPINQNSKENSYTLHLAEVQLKGASRTSVAEVYRHLDIFPGQAIDQSKMVAAIKTLRQSGLFVSLSYYTKPGQERGELILVLEVVEPSLDFRWAAGNSDFDGWYLVPAMLAYDNALGHGRLLDFQFRFGFRLQSLLVRYGQPHAGNGDLYWGGKLHLTETLRPYFSDDVEYWHSVKSAGLSTVFGKRFSSSRLTELGLKIEGVNVGDESTAHSNSQDGLIINEQTIDQEDLPEAINEAVGKHLRVVLHSDWQYDSRSPQKISGTPVSGSWGRFKARFNLQDRFTHLGLQADWRTYQKVPGGVLAVRARAAWVGENAAFYDKLYLGGMYSVRGFPSSSLSAPGGDTWLTSGSLEYRTQILGDTKGTRLAGVLFLDAGASTSATEDDPYKGVAVGAGYGLRMRVWWLDWVGLDVGFPLTERPLNMRFQVTASIGWSF